MEKKTPSPFKRDIDRAYKRLQLASMVLGNVSGAYDTGDLKEAYRNAFEFAYHAERLTLLARSLPALTGSPAARPKMERQIKEVLPLHIGYTAEGWFGVDMPALLPKKEHGGAEYIRHSLYLALGEYFKCHEKLRIDNCVLTVCHRYDKSRPEREYRDHDNTNLNAIIDALACMRYTMTLRFAVNTTIARLRTTGTQQRYCSFRNLNSLSAMSASKPTRKRCFHCSLNTQNAEKTYAFRGRKRPF